MSLLAPFMTKIVKKKEEEKFMILSSVHISSPVDLGAYLARTIVFLSYNLILEINSFKCKLFLAQKISFGQPLCTITLTLYLWHLLPYLFCRFVHRI